MVELIIASRYNGPPGSANGGYTCGLLAEQVGEPAEVTLRSPPPLDTPLRFDGTRLWDGETLVAEAHHAHVHLEVPEPVAFDDAERASQKLPRLREARVRDVLRLRPEPRRRARALRGRRRRNECLRCAVGRPG